MRKALVVGVNYYAAGDSLHGCVNDAYAVKTALERHSDGTINFSVVLMVANAAADQVTRAALRGAIKNLFDGDGDVALLYFAGHGHIEPVGGYLCASDSADGNDGVPLYEIVAMANQSRVRNRIIVLDSCHSGIAGASPIAHQAAELAEGLTILTASTKEQYASEENGAGVFTTLFVDALNGAAGNLVGDVTPGSVYAHVDQSLGPWKQRPVFKTNVQGFVSLRKVQPPINHAELVRLVEFFPVPGFHFPLTPDYEPDSDTPDPDKIVIFGILQKFNRVNLVVPVDAAHMYYAAMENKACKLTVLGEHYRRLVEQKLI